MGIEFFDFDTDKFMVAPIIYGENRHYTTNKGVIISEEIKRELKEFLSEFNVSVNIEQPPYYRIDAYFNEQALWLLELNASFVDGWGTALNLARASGIKIDFTRLVFPKRFASKNGVYLPELKLFVSELACLGLHDHEICEWNGNGVAPVYVYGRVGLKDQPHVLPYDGLRLDNKLNLGLFSIEWNGDLVKIPRHYINRFEPWDAIPQNVVLKFCDKGSAQCRRARQSVMFGKPAGKARFSKQCYKAETLLAQDFVPPVKMNGNNCQLIVFAIGNEPITGYVQYSPNAIINDNSIHGPLRIS